MGEMADAALNDLMDIDEYQQRLFALAPGHLTDEEYEYLEDPDFHPVFSSRSLTPTQPTMPPQVKRIPTGKIAPRGQSQRVVTTGRSLPTELNEPPTSLSDYCVCLYGAKGIGKSSLAAENEGFLTIMTEPFRRNLRIYQVPQVGEDPLDWPAIKEYIALGLAADHIRGFNIDSVDRAYDLCFDWICSQAGIKHPNEVNDYGATWRKISAEFEGLFNSVRSAGKGLWFLSHSKLRENSETVKSERFETVQPTAPPACFKYIKAVADFILYYGYTGRNRSLTVRGGGFTETGCGLNTAFLDPDGEELSSFHVGSPASQAFADLNAAYNNELRDCFYQPPVDTTRVKKAAPKRRLP